MNEMNWMLPKRYFSTKKRQWEFVREQKENHPELSWVIREVD